jgi:uncharacterized protein YcbK (DUF882 family)
MSEWIEAPNLKASEHFGYRELACRHCGEIISLEAVRKTAEWAERVREAMGGLPMHVNSGCRCSVHNKAVGGAPDSYHMKGMAIDVTFRGLSPAQAHKKLRVLQGKGLVGGLGRYSSFCHVDRGEKRNWVGP